MTCFCDVNCPIVVKSSSIEMSGGNLVITTPLVNLANMPNLQKIDLILCQCLPSDAGTAQVYLSDGTNTVPVNVETGNYLHADQLKCRRCYHMIYGDNPGACFTGVVLFPEHRLFRPQRQCRLPGVNSNEYVRHHAVYCRRGYPATTKAESG